MIQQFIVPSLAAVLVGSTALAAFCFRQYSSLKKQVQALAAGSAKDDPQKLYEPESRRSVPSDVSIAPANTSRRSQVMRLYKSGESVASIASVLGISQGEVKLTVKVGELLSESGSIERNPDFL